MRWILWDTFDALSYLAGVVFGTVMGAVGSWLVGLPRRVAGKVRRRG